MVQGLCDTVWSLLVIVAARKRFSLFSKSQHLLYTEQKNYCLKTDKAYILSQLGPTIRLRYDYDTTTTKNWRSSFARVESRRMEAGARDTS